MALQAISKIDDIPMEENTFPDDLPVDMVQGGAE